MKRESFLILIILIAASAIRLSVFRPDIGLTPSDIQRDYLVSSHIVSFGELPLRGPDGYSETLLPASPLYYYLLVPVLLIHRSIAALNIVNFVLQIAFLLILYHLARRLFDRNTALLSLCIAAVTPAFIDQTKVAWQPTIAQPFLYGGYILLLRAYATLQPRRVFWGLTLILCSLAIAPSSTIAVVPFLAIVLVLRRRRAFLPPIIGACGVLLLLFIAPFLLRVSGNPGVMSTWNTGILTDHASLLLSTGTINNFFTRAGIFTAFFRLPPVVLVPFLALLVLSKNKNSLLIAGAITGVLLFAAGVQTQGLPFPQRAFMPITGLAIIGAARMLRRLAAPVLIALVLLPIIMYPPTPDPLIPKKDILDALQQKITDPESFTLRVYHEGQEDPFAEIPIWIGLEERLNTQLVVLDDTQLWGYRLPDRGPRPDVFTVYLDGRAH